MICYMIGILVGLLRSDFCSGVKSSANIAKTRILLNAFYPQTLLTETSAEL